jgi:hypothetical protein
MSGKSIVHYYASAMVAVKYTQSILSMGAVNRSLLESVKETIAGGGENLLNQFVQRMVQLFSMDQGSGKLWVQQVADVAKEAKVGNCQEHAAVAAIFLRDRGVRPVEYTVLMKNGSYKHAFVVVGRDVDRYTKQLPGDPLSWKGPVIVCDAWEGYAFAPGKRAIYGSPGDYIVKARWE